VDIGKIDSSFISGVTGNAQQSISRAADESFEQKLNAAIASRDEQKLKQACREFEAIMLDMMYRQMKATIIRSDLVKRDAGTEIYESMLDEKLMEAASQTGSFGLAEMLYKQLSRNFKTSGAETGTGAIAAGARINVNGAVADADVSSAASDIDSNVEGAGTFADDAHTVKGEPVDGETANKDSE